MKIAGDSEFAFLDHTADVRMQLTARDLSGLFQAALQGMAELIYPGKCTQSVNDISERIIVSAPDLTVLLVDFLSEVLTYSHIDKAIFCDLQIERLSNTEITAIISGIRIDHFVEDIKAVTYHEAEVLQTGASTWETCIIFDI